MAEVLSPPTIPVMNNLNGSSANDAPLLKFAQTDMILPPPDLKGNVHFVSRLTMPIRLLVPSQICSDNWKNGFTRR